MKMKGVNDIEHNSEWGNENGIVKRNSSFTIHVALLDYATN